MNIWEFFVLSPQFFYKSKAFKKIQCILKNLMMMKECMLKSAIYIKFKTYKTIIARNTGKSFILYYHLKFLFFSFTEIFILFLSLVLSLCVSLYIWICMYVVDTLYTYVYILYVYMHTYTYILGSRDDASMQEVTKISWPDVLLIF